MISLDDFGLIILRQLPLIVLLLSAGIAAATDKPKITLDEFLNYVDFPTVQISPDGNSVIIAADRADWDREIFQTDLWLYRNDGRDGGSLLQLTNSGHESSPRWSPDGKWIAFLSERKPPGGKSGEDDGDDDRDKDSGDRKVAPGLPDFTQWWRGISDHDG